MRQEIGKRVRRKGSPPEQEMASQGPEVGKSLDPFTNSKKTQMVKVK